MVLTLLFGPIKLHTFRTLLNQYPLNFFNKSPIRALPVSTPYTNTDVFVTCFQQGHGYAVSNDTGSACHAARVSEIKQKKTKYIRRIWAAMTMLRNGQDGNVQNFADSAVKRKIVQTWNDIGESLAGALKKSHGIVMVVK
jgi:hypothetical protein